MAEPATTPQISVVIPCYRSAERLPELVRRITATLTPRGRSFEILLVNDASPDQTWESIQQVTRETPFVRGFDMQFNVGQFRATICGFEQARGETIITLDDDFQHPPEEIPLLLDALDTNPAVDCVVGAYRKKQHNLIRNLGSSLMGRINELLYDKPRGLQTTSFRALRRRVAETICAHKTALPIIGPLLLRSTRRISNVEVEHRQRQSGKSGYSIPRLIRITLDNLISGSTLPLKIVSLLGMLSAGVSFLLAAGYLVRYLTGGIGVPGFSTLVLLISFFGGMTLCSVGLLGEYVIRIIQEVSSPPRYLIRATAGIDNQFAATHQSINSLAAGKAA